MEILNKLTTLSASLGQGKEIVEQVKTELDGALQAKFEEGKALGLVEGEAIGYKKGFEAGKAEGGGTPSDKIYSQAEMDAALVVKSNEVKAVIKAKYDEAQAKESAIEAEVFAVEAVVEVPPAVEPVVEQPIEPVV